MAQDTDDDDWVRFTCTIKVPVDKYEATLDQLDQLEATEVSFGGSIIHGSVAGLSKVLAINARKAGED
jgi:hypothetical protein